MSNLNETWAVYNGFTAAFVLELLRGSSLLSKGLLKVVESSGL